jgi:hypothetical protein
VYKTLNRCNEPLLARANQRLKANVDWTADNHINWITNLLVDIDPVRPSGISSKNREHDAALEMAQIILADLGKQGWPEPLIGDSGNGALLIYLLDLPNGLRVSDQIKAVLKALSLRYQEHLTRLHLEIDQAVFNPIRLTKVYGTMTRKGDNTESRLHRMALILIFATRATSCPPGAYKEAGCNCPCSGSEAPALPAASKGGNQP